MEDWQSCEIRYLCVLISTKVGLVSLSVQTLQVHRLHDVEGIEKHYV